ncbi:MAG: TIGR01440 family protein [Clostridiales bacterium]|jgi:uncharacterized protein (TIGR01440 family)|nr:TIGR01440 family protein [Clostridiales bacterium]
MYEEIAAQAGAAVRELLEKAGLKEGDLFVVGCSSSEIGGHRIGSDSNVEIGKTVFEAIYAVLKEKKIELAAQCCEHLNRAVILERDAAARRGLEIVNAVPQPKAGGSFATAAYRGLEHPVAVEEVSAQAGIDIGGTLIGMHLARVAVPVRLSVDHIGSARILCARTRPKYIGGERAHYDEALK